MAPWILVCCAACWCRLGWGRAALRPAAPVVGSAHPLVQAEWQLDMAQPKGGVVLMLILFTKIPLCGCYIAITTKRCQCSSGLWHPSRLRVCRGMSPARAAQGGGLRGLITEGRGRKVTEAVRVSFTSWGNHFLWIVALTDVDKGFCPVRPLLSWVSNWKLKFTH